MARATYLYLYLSPHLDDAVLSVGGLIASQLTGGANVVVATTCTADPPADGILSPLAASLHRRWGDPTKPSGKRRQEDIAACHALGGAEPRHLGLPDAIYRGRAGQYGYRYETFEALFEPIPSWDMGFTDTLAIAVERLAQELQPSQVFGPLGVGSNVDHLHVRNAVLRMSHMRAVGLYEEQPYSTGRYPVATIDPVGSAVRRSSMSLWPMTHPIDWTTKCHAISSYKSQLTPLFGAEREGLSALEHYSRTLGEHEDAMERVWYLPPFVR